MYGIAVETQGAILDEVSSLVDSGRIRSHMHDCVSWKDFQKAFQLLEQRKTIGKVRNHPAARFVSPTIAPLTNTLRKCNPLRAVCAGD